MSARLIGQRDASSERPQHQVHERAAHPRLRVWRLSAASSAHMAAASFTRTTSPRSSSPYRSPTRTRTAKQHLCRAHALYLHGPHLRTHFQVSIDRTILIET